MANRGFEVEVIENYQNALNCVICSLIINKATHGCERHIFCEGCIQEYLTKSCQNSIPVCPGGCRKVIDPKKLSPNLAFDMMINKLKSKCSFKDCSWTGDLLDLVKDHRSQCSYATIKCLRNGCGESFLKENTEKHDNICLYKYLQCCYCENDVLRMNKNDHEKSCAMEKVNCIYHEVGCNIVMYRRDVDKHEHDYQSLHMKLSFRVLTKENTVLKLQLSQITVEVNTLKEENNVLKQKVFKTFKEVASKEEVIELNKNVSKTATQVLHLKENIKRKTWSEIEKAKERSKDLIPLQYDVNDSRIIIKLSAISLRLGLDCHQQNHYQLGSAYQQATSVYQQHNLQQLNDSKYEQGLYNALDKLVKKPNYYENVGDLLSLLMPQGSFKGDHLGFLTIIPYHWFDFTAGGGQLQNANMPPYNQQLSSYNGFQRQPMWADNSFLLKNLYSNVPSNIPTSNVLSSNQQIQHMITFPVNNNNIEDFMCQYEYKKDIFTVQSDNNTIQVSGFQSYNYKFKVAIDGKEKKIDAEVGLKLFETRELITRKTFCSGCVIIYST